MQEYDMFLCKTQLGCLEFCKYEGECQNIWKIGVNNETNNKNDADCSEDEKENHDLMGSFDFYVNWIYIC